MNFFARCVSMQNSFQRSRVSCIFENHYLSADIRVRTQCVPPTQENVDTSLFDYHACCVTWDRKGFLIIPSCSFDTYPFTDATKRLSKHRVRIVQGEIEYKQEYVAGLIASCLPSTFIFLFFFLSFYSELQTHSRQVSLIVVNFLERR